MPALQYALRGPQTPESVRCARTCLCDSGAPAPPPQEVGGQVHRASAGPRSAYPLHPEELPHRGELVRSVEARAAPGWLARRAVLIGWPDVTCKVLEVAPPAVHLPASRGITEGYSTSEAPPGEHSCGHAAGARVPASHVCRLRRTLEHCFLCEYRPFLVSLISLSRVTWSRVTWSRVTWKPSRVCDSDAISCWAQGRA